MCKKRVRLIFLGLMLIFAGTASANLVGHWKFDEGSGAIAADSSGNGYEGTLFGNPQWIAGYLNGGLEFDRNDDCVRKPPPRSEGAQIRSRRLVVPLVVAARCWKSGSRSNAGLGGSQPNPRLFDVKEHHDTISTATECIASRSSKTSLGSSTNSVFKFRTAIR